MGQILGTRLVDVAKHKRHMNINIVIVDRSSILRYPFLSSEYYFINLNCERSQANKTSLSGVIL